jgi:hypothetical protein
MNHALFAKAVPSPSRKPHHLIPPLPILAPRGVK